ncbi:hypothetical protein FJT64_016657 [Amphibalanus amphitrite]|uniref:Uncharacterized protein n=1 Tax=Amphibalanus amphitrite TaxID=1232801 RepID=A0A6A4WYK4_AMPAM|nr:hypothetical protein FJT64_016657 [Amphibalanus amphitrite]
MSEPNPLCSDFCLSGTDTDPVIHARPLPGASLAPPAGLAVFTRRHSLKLSANQREEHFRRASSMRYPSGLCLQHSVIRRTYTDETATSEEFSVLERPSLLSKLLRLAVPRRQLATFSAQFPPPEWTNGDVTHLHSIGTQTAPSCGGHWPPAERSPKVS